MKWPKKLSLVRHGQSTYNILRAQKESDPLYQSFKLAFEKDFQSTETLRLAQEVSEKFSLGVSDYETPLTEAGKTQARETGKRIPGLIPYPDVVFLSPYLRTRNTFECMTEEWPALLKTKIVSEYLVREQEHGLSLLYNDWRVFHTLNPDQKKLFGLLGPYWYQYPQGESVSQVRDRGRDFAGMLIREYAEQNVLVITHHLTILSMRANFERLSPEQFMHMDEHEKPVNCGVTTYKGNPKLGKDGKLELEYYNKQLWT